MLFFKFDMILSQVNKKSKELTSNNFKVGFINKTLNS